VVREVPARPASAPRYVFGEGLRYDAECGRLLWVDLTAGRLFSAPLDDPDDARLEVQVDGPLGVAAPLADDDGWLLGAGRGLATAGPQGGVRHLVDLEPETNRVNDGACDARGRFWLGSMAWDETEGAGTLHRVDLDGSVTPVLRGVSIANGPAWSPDGSVLYLDDSGRSVLLAYDVDEVTGGLSGRRVLVQFEGGAGDGLTVDDEGHLWVAVFGGSAVHRYDPAGRLVARVPLPASQVTSCCLAEGRLFATTAAKGLEHPEDDAGRLFVADVGVGGAPVRPFRGALSAG
jgi:sugar lactone lactonase YvrE